MTKDNRRLEELVTSLKSWMHENQATLQAAGIEQIIGSYYGSGDEGYFDDVQAVLSDGMPAEYEVPAEVAELVEKLFETAVGGGFEDGEGGGGQIILDVASAKVRHSSYYNVINQEDLPVEEL